MSARKRNGWYIEQSEGGYLLARHTPARFDFVVQTTFPKVSKRRLARQIRQDMWRRLQGQRGFSPVVSVREIETGLLVQAGGRLDDRLQSWATRQLEDLLSNPIYRNRWIDWAGKASHYG